jgi:hypothetical protein
LEKACDQTKKGARKNQAQFVISVVRGGKFTSFTREVRARRDKKWQ